MDDAFIRRSRRLRLRAIIILNSSLPGLTPQVGFTRLAAHTTAQLGQARVAVQSILFAKKSCAERWTTRNRVYPISGRFECASRVNPTCVVKPAGDARRLGASARGGASGRKEAAIDRISAEFAR